MKLSQLLIAGLLTTSLTISASTTYRDDKKPLKGEKKLEKQQIKKATKKKSIAVKIKRLNACEACGRG